MHKEKLQLEPVRAKKLEAALYYQKKGFSIIPARPDKKPYIKWAKYQTQRASVKQIKMWWKQWPTANPAVVCGKISGINVLDIDSAEGWQNLNENFLSESFLTLISNTPGGGYHIFFKYAAGLSNGVRILPGTDLRTDGGYAILPPADNGKGKKYSWLPELHISKVKPAPMPDFLYDILRQASDAVPARAQPRAYKNKVSSLYKEKSSSINASPCERHIGKTHNNQQNAFGNIQEINRLPNKSRGLCSACGHVRALNA